MLRPKVFNKILNLLCRPESSPFKAKDVALYGTGGFGKTTLATELCWNPSIRTVFRDGILWIALGNAVDLLPVQAEWLLPPRHENLMALTSSESVITNLREQPRDSNILIVIDNLWSYAELEPFNIQNEHWSRLVTTRNAEEVPDYFDFVRIPPMEQFEAVELLKVGFEDDPNLDSVGDYLSALADRVGRWPLLLKLINSSLRKKVLKFQEYTLLEAVINLKKKLKGKQARVNWGDVAELDKVVANVMEISLQDLQPQLRQRYCELAIFPEHIEIPLEILKKLWFLTGGVDEEVVEDLCSQFNRASLLLEFEKAKEAIRIHHVIRDYLCKEMSDRLPLVHDELVKAYSAPSSQNWVILPENEPYLWNHLAFHLRESTTDVHFGIHRCRFNHDGNLIALASEDDGKLKIWDANSGALLYSVDVFAARVSGGHDGGVMSCDFSPVDPAYKQIVTASSDCTIKLWDTVSHKMLRTFGESKDEAHKDKVKDCCFSPNGILIASASADSTLKIWAAGSGQLLNTLKYSGEVNCCTFANDGKWIISASSDGKLKIWDVTANQLIKEIPAHLQAVNCCSFSNRKRKIVTASSDNTLIIWDADSYRALHTLKGHSASVNGCCFSTDDLSVISASSDETIKIWDIHTGQCCATFRADGEMYCCAMHEDKIVAGGARGVYFLKLLR